MSANRQGYRGYIASRPVRGEATPQQVQNLVVRDYARRRGLAYKLSATEYAMPGCYMILESVLDELASLEGVICFSLFMLPEAPARRERLYQRLFDAGCSLHGALEALSVSNAEEASSLEDIFRLDRLAQRIATELPDGLR